MSWKLPIAPTWCLVVFRKARVGFHRGENCVEYSCFIEPCAIEILQQNYTVGEVASKIVTFVGTTKRRAWKTVCWRKKETTSNHEGRKFQANSQLKGKILKKWRNKDIVIVLRIREGWEGKERLVKAGKINEVVDVTARTVDFHRDYLNTTIFFKVTSRSFVKFAI